MPTRVGLLTLPLHKNYGGFLQAAALYEHLTNLGCDVILLERSPPKPRPQAATTAVLRRSIDILSPFDGDQFLVTVLTRFLKYNQGAFKGAHALRRFISNQHFVREFLPLRSGHLRDAEDMGRAIGRFNLDAVIVGSDQVWRPDYVPYNSLPDFFLGFAQKTSLRRISYAASFGHSEWRHPDHTAEVTKLLADFSAVSVREASGVDICRDVFGRGDAVHVLDPTLLVDPAFYDRVADAPTGKTDKVLFEYILDHDGGAPTIGEDIAASLWDAYLVRSVALDAESSLLGVGGWVRAIMDADFIMTDSFHGMVFSIIFRKNFLAVVNHKRGADRFISLTRLLGLEDRLIDGDARAQARELAARPIDYAAVSVRLEALRARSRAFLAAALGGPET